MRMCKPKRRKQGDTELLWAEDPNDLARLSEYCKRDVEAEEALINALRPLPPSELATWRLDQIINRRGIQADLGAAAAMLQMVEEHEGKLLARLGRLTHGAVKTAKQVEVLRAHLRGLGVDLPDLAAATVRAALEGEINPVAREILEIRQSLGRSSSAKYQAMLDRAGSDGRIRDMLVYHGASTGRWAGSGLQPQNFPSRIKVSADPEDMLAAVEAGGLDLFSSLYDDDPMSAAGMITRSCLVAAPGKVLFSCDFGSVEGRGAAWMSGEEWILNEYRRLDREGGPDMYEVAAASIVHKPANEITKDERTKYGKPTELGGNFGGGVGAIRRFGGGEGMTDDEVRDQIINPWREARPKIVAFWAALEQAAMDAVANPGQVFNACCVKFMVADKFLKCRLPSGRILYYYDPKIMDCETSWGAIKPSVTFMAVDPMTKQWKRESTYGGRLCENVVSGTCRDIMAEAMLRLEAAGYHIVLTVHDEIVSEVSEDFGSVKEFVDIMCEVPAWAKGFPIAASGWRGKRYRK